MIGVGVAGALIAVFGMVVGWIFVGQLASASDDSLEVTLQTLDAVDDTIDLADEVLVATSDGVAALASTLTAVSASFDTGTQAIDDIAGLAETIGPSLEDASGTVRTLEKIGGDIDALLVALSSLPVGPDYNPQAGLGDTLGTLADTLEELPGQLERNGGQPHRVHRHRRRTAAAARRSGDIRADDQRQSVRHRIDRRPVPRQRGQCASARARRRTTTSAPVWC